MQENKSAKMNAYNNLIEERLGVYQQQQIHTLERLLENKWNFGYQIQYL